MQPVRKWRRTAIELNDGLVPLRDSWSLIDEESGLAVAEISKQPDDHWRYVIRAISENEIKDAEMGWRKSGPEAKQYCEWRTQSMNFKIERKRTKAEILAHADVRPMPKDWK